mgnify:CR=1 FL=1
MNTFTKTQPINEPNTIGIYITAMIEHFNVYCAERKELKSLYSYHSENSAYLEQAKRDANRVWQSQI